jgi:hypothetical protein
MKKISVVLFVGAIAALFSPAIVAAHERGVFEIGGSYYQFVIGSQNEPIVVDDKSGLDFRAQKLASSTSESGTPVTGLEKTLKVEISAQGKKRTQDITTVYGQLGAYNSLFYPTIATAYTYRIFGTIEGSPVDLSFTCHAGAHVMGGTPDRTPKDMGGGVTRVMQAGMFSCPMEKAELGFPKQSAEIAGLGQNLSAQGALLTNVNREFRLVEIALGFLAIAFAVVSLRKKKPLG